MKNKFTLEYWLDDGWYVGKLKEVPGIFSQGKTLAELKENIQEAYDLIIETEKQEFPVSPTTKIREVKVAV